VEEKIFYFRWGKTRAKTEIGKELRKTKKDEDISEVEVDRF
jgi:hypothetical protein